MKIFRFLLFALVLVVPLQLHAVTAPPANFVATSNNQSVQLTWTYGTGAKFYVYRKPQQRLAKFKRVGSSIQPAFTDPNLAVGTYLYYVTAVVGGVQSAPSNTVTIAVVQLVSTSVQLTIAPCIATPFSCSPGKTAVEGQTVSITVHVVYSGTVAPTGQLCVNVNNSLARTRSGFSNRVQLAARPARVFGALSSNCGLTPVTDETWYTPALPVGANQIQGVYSGDTKYAGSSSPVGTITITQTPPTPISISSINPTSGTVGASTVVTGSGFVSGTLVSFVANGVSTAGVATLISSTQLSVVTPSSLIAGTFYDVTVTNPDGTNATLPKAWDPPVK